MAARRRSYSPESKDKAVAYVLQQDKTVGAAARELGIGETCLRKWASAARQAGRSNTEAVAEEAGELRRLKAENGNCKCGSSCKKRAAAFFANEMRA
jgi:transposase-like protein